MGCIQLRYRHKTLVSWRFFSVEEDLWNIFAEFGCWNRAYSLTRKTFSWHTLPVVGVYKDGMLIIQNRDMIVLARQINKQMRKINFFCNLIVYCFITMLLSYWFSAVLRVFLFVVVILMVMSTFQASNKWGAFLLSALMTLSVFNIYFAHLFIFFIPPSSRFLCSFSYMYLYSSVSSYEYPAKQN